jgi:type IV secretion system protein VirB10
MDTSTPGYVACVIPKDVYSDTGGVVLMEKGTRVLGEYQAGMRQGQARLFVLWVRAVTPAGVAIELASPASDSLGRAGFDGTVDSRFWARFGGALMLTVVDSGASAAASNDSRYPGVVRLPSDAAGVALENSINIPPTLRKAQGSEVSIFVAQDLDFASVYALRAR